MTRGLPILMGVMLAGCFVAARDTELGAQLQATGDGGAEDAGQTGGGSGGGGGGGMAGGGGGGGAAACVTDDDCACDHACVTPGGGIPASCTPRAAQVCTTDTQCTNLGSSFVCAPLVRKGARCPFSECRAGPPNPGAPGMVQCGAAWCGPTELCLLAYNGGSPRGSPTCIARGSEPGSPNQFGNVLAYCDSDDDCAAGKSCGYVRGENDRFECTDEALQCTVHYGHVCVADTNCHPCSNFQNPARCKPAIETAAPQLRYCDFF